MNDTIVTVRFTDIGAARRALRMLKLLDSEGQLRVRAGALVERPALGRVGSPSGAEDDESAFLPGGGVVGTLVDALLLELPRLPIADPPEPFRDDRSRRFHAATIAGAPSRTLSRRVPWRA